MSDSVKQCSEFGDDYQLVDRDYEIEDYLDHVGVTAEDIGFHPGSLFLKATDGEVDELWASWHTVPWLNARYERIDNLHGDLQ